MPNSRQFKLPGHRSAASVTKTEVIFKFLVGCSKKIEYQKSNLKIFFENLKIFFIACIFSLSHPARGDQTVCPHQNGACPPGLSNCRMYNST